MRKKADRRAHVAGLEDAARMYGRRLKRDLPTGAGFVLVLFDYGPGGDMTYLSTAERPDMVKMLRELATKVEKHHLGGEADL